MGALGLGSVAAPFQPDVVFSGVVDLPSDWGNVNINSYVSEVTDQYDTRPHSPPYFDLISSEGQHSLADGFKPWTDTAPFLTGTFAHNAGTAFSITWTNDVSCCEVKDSTDLYQFDLIFSSADPVVTATPEPSSYLLLGTGIVALLIVVTKRSSAFKSTPLPHVR